MNFTPKPSPPARCTRKRNPPEPSLYIKTYKTASCPEAVFLYNIKNRPFGQLSLINRIISYIRTEGFAFITVQFNELDVLCRADSIDFETAEEQLKDAICQKCGKLELKQHYRSWAVKMKEAGYSLNQAATEIRRIFDHYRTPYPTERTIRNHIQDIIPPRH